MSHATKPTILIVDDEPAIADGHAARLHDYDVQTAYDGETALDALKPEVDIVLLDRRLPGLTGEAVLERIRDRNVDCSVVMLTGVEPSVDDVEMSFDEYLQKPISESTLRQTIERVHRRSNYDSELQEYFSLASKRATLETQYARAELETEPMYRHLCERIRSVQRRLDEVLADLPEEDGYLVATEETEEPVVDLVDG